MTCKSQSWCREVDHWVWGKNKRGKRKSWVFPESSLGTVTWAALLQVQTVAKSTCTLQTWKKSVTHGSQELNLCPRAELHLLIPKVLLDQSGRSQDTTEQNPLHTPKFCAGNRESSAKRKNKRNNPYFTTTISVTFQEDYMWLSHH